MKVTNAFRVSAPRDKVAAVLCKEAFNVEREKQRDGVVSTRFVVTRDDEKRMDFELRSTERKRGMTGAFDRSATVETVTKHTVDREAGVMTWTYQGDGGGLIRLSGVYRMTAEGEEATRVVHEVTIDVRIPLVGGQIAKLIARGFEQSESSYRDIVERHID